MPVQQATPSVEGLKNPETILSIIESIKTIQSGQKDKPGLQQPLPSSSQGHQNPLDAPDNYPASNAGEIRPGMSEAAVILAEETEGDSHYGAIGPFGWVGIAFLCCLVFACATNIYLKYQKKKMEIPPTKEELEKLAPGAFETGNS